ncbi:MAG: hypothetical protein IKX31_03180 [Muribaculaceae bacterium]|nr:hypothetical protein [Muribaculaceae bacterium]
MNKAIKIGLIAIAVLVIGIVVWRTLIMPPAMKEIKFDGSVFSTQIKTMTEDSIKDAAGYDKAQQAFNSMLQDIDDAEFLENIDSKEATECKKVIAQGLAPKLAAHGDTVFAASDWKASELDAMRDAAKTIIATEVLPSKSEDLEKLQALIKNVDDYHSALAVASSGSHCSSESELNSLNHKIKSFNRAPLNNCKSLMSALNAAPGKAKANIARIAEEKRKNEERAEQAKREKAKREEEAKQQKIENDVNSNDDEYDF